jgi:hypothetical protein
LGVLQFRASLGKYFKTPSQPIPGHGGMCMSPQVTQEAKIREDRDYRSAQAKKFARSHLNR